MVKDQFGQSLAELIPDEFEWRDYGRKIAVI
jgi:hypothetical protein